jgi:hypothetical protein
MVVPRAHPVNVKENAKKMNRKDRRKRTDPPQKPEPGGGRSRAKLLTGFGFYSINEDHRSSCRYGRKEGS